MSNIAFHFFDGFHTKIYYPNDDATHDKIGLFVGPELFFNLGVSDELGIYSFEFTQANRDIMLEYLRAARDKFLSDNIGKQ